MSTEKTSSEAGLFKPYLETWVESACQVLGQLSKAEFTSSELPAQEAEAQVKSLAEGGVWVRFATSKQLQGEQAMLVSAGDAVRMAQMLMTEPLDASRPFSADYADALGEVFRQFAGIAAPTLKPKMAGEVELQFAGNDRPTWEAAHQSSFTLTGEPTGPFQLCVVLSPQLVQALRSIAEAKAQPPAQILPTPEAPSRDRNIDLLMDVELEVALRFGARELALREILELNAGAVVELDQKIEEPVELLLGGKVVARGEVVVTEGNYALRVTEIVSPMERVASLPKG